MALQRYRVFGNNQWLDPCIDDITVRASDGNFHFIQDGVFYANENGVFTLIVCCDFSMDIDVSNPTLVKYGELYKANVLQTDYLIKWVDELGNEIFRSAAGIYYDSMTTFAHPNTTGVIYSGYIKPVVLNYGNFTYTDEDCFGLLQTASQDCNSIVVNYNDVAGLAATQVLRGFSGTTDSRRIVYKTFDVPDRIKVFDGARNDGVLVFDSGITSTFTNIVIKRIPLVDITNDFTDIEVSNESAPDQFTQYGLTSSCCNANCDDFDFENGMNYEVTVLSVEDTDPNYHAVNFNVAFIDDLHTFRDDLSACEDTSGDNCNLCFDVTNYNFYEFTNNLFYQQNCFINITQQNYIPRVDTITIVRSSEVISSSTYYTYAMDSISYSNLKTKIQAFNFTNEFILLSWYRVITNDPYQEGGFQSSIYALSDVIFDDINSTIKIKAASNRATSVGCKNPPFMNETFPTLGNSSIYFGFGASYQTQTFIKDDVENRFFFETSCGNLYYGIRFRLTQPAETADFNTDWIVETRRSTISDADLDSKPFVTLLSGS